MFPYQVPLTPESQADTGSELGIENNSGNELPDSETDDEEDLVYPKVGIIGCENNVSNVCRLLHKEAELKVLAIPGSNNKYNAFGFSKENMKKNLKDIIIESKIIINVYCDLHRSEDNRLFNAACVNDYNGKYYIDARTNTEINSMNSIVAVQHIINTGGKYLELFVQNEGKIIFESPAVIGASGDKETFDGLKRFLENLAYKSDIHYFGELGQSCKLRSFLKLQEALVFLATNEAILLTNLVNIPEAKVLKILGKDDPIRNISMESSCNNELIDDNEILKNEILGHVNFLSTFLKNINDNNSCRSIYQACADRLVGILRYCLRFLNIRHKKYADYHINTREKLQIEYEIDEILQELKQ